MGRGGRVQGAWPPIADAGSLSASQKAAKRQPNDTPMSIRHMLGLVSGSQGALPPSRAGSGGLAHPPTPQTLRPGQHAPAPAPGRRPHSWKLRQPGGKGHQQGKGWSSTGSLIPKPHTPLPQGQESPCRGPNTLLVHCLTVLISSWITRSTHFRQGSFSLTTCFFTMASNAKSGVKSPVLKPSVPGGGGDKSERNKARSAIS